MKMYFSAYSEFSVVNGMLLYRNRIVIPEGQRMEVLDKLHASHQGITKCREQLKKDIIEKVLNCQFCQESRPKQRHETLKPTILPDGPWQKIAADLCELNLVIMDYHSKSIEIGYLNKPTSACVIGKLENMCAHWGDAEGIVCDNGSVIISAQFKQFAQEHNIKLSYSSDHMQQAHGGAEAGVKSRKTFCDKTTCSLR